MSIPSYITLLRIILIFPIMYLIITPSFWNNIWALSLFLVAGLTDYLDGYVARKTSSETSLGALLDLLADKLLVCIVLVWLVYVKQSTYLIIPVLIIISRELIISSLRQYIVEHLGKNEVKVSAIGKSKTSIQFLAISLLIIGPNFGYYFNSFATMTIWLAAFLSIYSMLAYYNEWKDYI